MKVAADRLGPAAKSNKSGDTARVIILISYIKCGYIHVAASIGL